MSIHFRFTSALAVGATIMCSAAQAADNTRYISITGNNANACTLAKPCRTLQRGINVTPVGGELRILNSGFFGNNATIKKSLTISGNGNTVYLGTTVTINDADAVVTLRDLVLDGQGTIDKGIFIDNAAAVHIERCEVHAFTSRGIDSSAFGAKLFVIDSVLRENGVSGLTSLSDQSFVVIDNSHFNNNGNIGVEVHNDATISNSTMSGNAQTGLAVSSDGAIARISNSTIVGNGTGISNTGTLETRQNNTVRKNVTNYNGITGTLTPINGF